MEKPNRRGVLTAIFLCVPAVFLAILIQIYGVDVPYLDQFGELAITASARRGALQIHWLWAQRNESRSVVPSLLFIVIDFLGKGNLKYEMFAMLPLTALVLWNVHRLAVSTLSPGWGRSLATVLASLLIFSPVQWENWLWGIQLISFIPIACLTSAIVVCYSKLSAWAKLYISAALALVATYSFANGMICWGVIFGLVLAQFRTVQDRVKAAVAWAAFAGVSLAFYFRGFRRLPNVSGWRDLPAYPVKAVHCFLAFLGAPLGVGKGLEHLNWATSVGVLVLGLVCLAVLQLIRFRNKTGIWRQSAGWLTLGAYSLANAVLTTVGRGRDTQLFLLDSRYTTFSLYTIVALIFLLPILYGESSGPWFRESIWIGLTLATLFLVLHARNSFYAVEQMRDLRADRLQAKACLAFAKAIDSDCQTERLDWNHIELMQVAWAIGQVDYAHPPLVESSDQLNLAVPPGAPNQYGAFESLTKIRDGFYRASGWAVLPDRSEPADGVVLSSTKADGGRTFLALADRTNDRTDIAASLGHPAYESSGWEQWIELPNGATAIQAWGYDALSGRLYPLTGSRAVTNVAVENIDFNPDEGGAFDYVVPGDPSVAGGWALLPKQDKPADRVLLTCGAGDPIIATAAPSQPRPDLGKAFFDLRVRPGWRISIPLAREPAQGCDLRAWAWSRQTHAAALLRPMHKLPPVLVKPVL